MGRDNGSCVDELADILRALSKDSCEVEVILTAGEDCCRIQGIICGLKKDDCILVLVDTKKDRKCFIPIDKIAAVCNKCPGSGKWDHGHDDRH